MAAPKTYKGVLKRLKTADKDIKEYFTSVEGLINNYSYEIVLAYLFSQTEKAQNMAIYCGLVRLHAIHLTLASQAVQNERITRPIFRELYKRVFGKEIPKNIIDIITEAEKIRDKAMHGKTVTPREMRKAIVDLIDYAERLNDFTYKIARLRPFGDLRGFKGRGQPLPRTTSRWVLKGMGFETFS